MHYRSLVSGVLIILLQCTRAPRDDGYKLWLKFPVIKEQGVLFRQIQSVSVQGESATLSIVREELARGLNGLLGRELSEESNP